MALLTRGVALLAAGLVVAGCEERANTVGRMEAFLFEQAVVCDPATEQCMTLEQPPALPVPEHAKGRAFVSARASRHSPGLYLYFEFTRPSGAVAQVEIDLSTSQGGDAARAHLKYQEYRDGVRVFSSSAATGSLLLPAHALGAASRCECEDGLIELRFVDHGPDQQPGTADDRQRHLSRLRYSREIGYFCRNARLLELTDRFQVGPLRDCPVTHNAPAPTSGGGDDDVHDYEGEVGCAAAADDVYYEDEGCEASDDSGYDDEAGGCGGDYESDSDYDTGDEGCEGDDSDSDYGSSDGCAGDDSSGSSSSGCEGDAYAAVKRPRHRAGRWRRALGLLWPLVALGAIHGALRRRRRRRRPRID